MRLTMKNEAPKLMFDFAAKLSGFIVLAAITVFMAVPLANAEEKMVPYGKDHPIPHPVVTTWNIPPLVTAKPSSPVYIPSLDGLVSGKNAVNFAGGKVLKNDGLVIKKSSVRDGKVVIPAGGFVFMFDTWVGDIPLVGGMEFVFGEENAYYYVDYPGASIAKATNVTLKLGESVVVGDQIFTYGAAAPHGKFTNPAVELRYKLGGDWAFVGMSPAVFSIGATTEDPGKDFHYGHPVSTGYKPGGEKQASILDFNQLFANRKDISTNQIKFSTIYATDVQSWNMCKAPLAYKGRAGKGTKIDVKDLVVEVVGTNRDQNRQSASVRISKGGKTVAEKTLVWEPAKDKDFYRSPYNVEWQKKVLLKHGDITVQLLASQWISEDAVDKGGKANLVVYKDCVLVEDGKPSPWDSKFIVDNSVCPQGHGFGAIFYNKDEIVLTREKNVFAGPAGHVRIVIDDIKGDTAKFHVESKTGAKSLAFIKKGNVDLLLGKGRAVQDIAHDTGHATQEEMYRQLAGK